MTSMRNGVRVARQVQMTEKAVDSAMVAASALIQAMIECRGDAGLAAEVGHGELTAVVTGLGRLNEVRGLVVQAHSGLAAVADDQGIVWRMDGPYEHKNKPVAVAA